MSRAMPLIRTGGVERKTRTAVHASLSSRFELPSALSWVSHFSFPASLRSQTRQYTFPNPV